MSNNDYRAEERAAQDEAEKAIEEACKAIEATASGDAAAIAEHYSAAEEHADNARSHARKAHTYAADEAARNAANAVIEAELAISELAYTIGEALADEAHATNAERMSAHNAAFAELTAQPWTATAEDRAAVNAMVESIAEEAETAAAYAAFEANRREHIGEYLIKYEWSGEGLYRIAWSDGGQKSDPHHYESAEELAADLTSAYQHATETHQPYAERLEYYERYELEAYLGEPSDFDVEAIEAEATDTDEHGNRYWTADAEELAAIAQRNRR